MLSPPKLGPPNGIEATPFTKSARRTASLPLGRRPYEPWLTPDWGPAGNEGQAFCKWLEFEWKCCYPDSRRTGDLHASKARKIWENLELSSDKLSFKFLVLFLFYRTDGHASNLLGSEGRFPGQGGYAVRM